MNAIFTARGSEAEKFRRDFDKRPFMFGHNLHDVNLFRMPALLELAEKAMCKKGRSHFESGDKSPGMDFGGAPEGMTIRRALDEIERGRNWVVLKRIHEEPGYAELLAQCTSELSALTGRNLRAQYFDPIMTVFITSPDRVTPYHIDSESNFLAQIAGSKTVYLYDAAHPAVLRAEDLEKYWLGLWDKPVYSPELEQFGQAFEVSPGAGIFNPPTYPHWVRNRDNVSISVSINFKKKRSARVSSYRMNHYLRKIGLSPVEPGRYPALDAAKDLSFGTAYNIARSLPALKGWRRRLRNRP